MECIHCVGLGSYLLGNDIEDLQFNQLLEPCTTDLETLDCKWQKHLDCKWETHQQGCWIKSLRKRRLYNAHAYAVIPLNPLFNIYPWLEDKSLLKGLYFSSHLLSNLHVIPMIWLIFDSIIVNFECFACWKRFSVICIMILILPNVM